jgi:hypothetical protein
MWESINEKWNKERKKTWEICKKMILEEQLENRNYVCAEDLPPHAIMTIQEVVMNRCVKFKP